MKSSATSALRRRLLWASQACPSVPPLPNPSPLGLGRSVRPGSLLRSLTHDEPPVRPRRLSETGPDLGSDSYSSLGAATSPRLGLRSGSGSDSQLPDSFFGSLVSQQLPRRTSRRGRERGAAATARWKPRPERPRRHFRHKSPADRVQILWKPREKKKKRLKDLELLLLLFSWKRRACEIGKFEFSF